MANSVMDTASMMRDIADSLDDEGMEDSMESRAPAVTAFSFSSGPRQMTARRMMRRSSPVAAAAAAAHSDDDDDDECFGAAHDRGDDSDGHDSEGESQLQQERFSSRSSAAVVAAADSKGRKQYLTPIEAALAVSIDAGYTAFIEQKALPANADSPSFYLYTAQAFRDKGAAPSLCMKVVTNVLETSLCNSQTCRVVAYFLLSIGLMDTAVQAFENVVVLAPEEPQSQTDLAFAKFFRLREKAGKPGNSSSLNLADGSVAEMVSEVQAVVGLLCFVIKKTDIPQRFTEIEWPVLILLSWVVDWTEWRLKEFNSEAVSGQFWPEAELPAEKYRLKAKLDVFIWLGWDTDKTDIDLHVLEPTGEECNYSHNRSRSTGACVSRDFTQGYGPECYVLPNAPQGTYKVRTKYYGSHQDSKTTGSTSCVIWSVKHLGDFEREEALFTSVRRIYI